MYINVVLQACKLAEFFVKCPGTPGHGSQFLERTAGEKLRRVIDRFMDYRAEQERKMRQNNLTLGNVITVNLTMLQV